MILVNSLALSHAYVKKAVGAGDTVIDATCGKGRDTLFLSRLVGETGIVYAFDIQDAAIESTKDLLHSESVSNTRVIKDSHENINDYVDGEIACAMFNLGYLPGTDHSIQTNGASTAEALSASMKLLKKNGIITIVIYQGGDTGFGERDAVLDYCSRIDQSRYTVMKTGFINQKNHPPLFICIERM